MFPTRLVRFGFASLVLALGIWLIFQVPRPKLEPSSHSRGVQPQSPGRAIDLNTHPNQRHSEGPSPAIIHPPVAPVTVHLAGIRPNQYDPNNLVHRWQRGQASLEEREGLLPEEELERLKAAALHLRADEDVQLASRARLSAPTPSLSFDSLDFTECCGGGGNTPPDPELAVGPDHIIAVVNSAFEIYDKSGNALLGPITYASFFNIEGCNILQDPQPFEFALLFDPNVLYDESEDRFFLAVDRLRSWFGLLINGGSNYCVAVSATNDPTGAWNVYIFPMDLSGPDTLFMDYPHAGVGRDAIYMGGNLFTTDITPFFLEGRVWAFDKAAMYAGAPASAVEQGLGVSEDTPQPLNLHGYNQGTWPPDGPHYLLTETGFNGADHTLFSWEDPFGTNLLAAVGTMDLNAATGVNAGLPIDVPQSGGGALAANDWRPLDFEYRNGYGWTTMTISCNPGGGSVNCVRWAQINLATGEVAQAGVFAADGEHRFFPDLAVNQCDDMLVGYTKSSPSMYPAVWYTGRQSSDPAGVLQAEAELKAGELPYTSFEPGPPRRWGDYSGMTIDPDGETFWYLGEYSKDTGTTDGRWGNYIGAFQFDPCGGGGPTPTAINSPTPSQTPGPTDTPTPIGSPSATVTPTGSGTPPDIPTPTQTATPGPPLIQGLYLPMVIVAPP